MLHAQVDWAGPESTQAVRDRAVSRRSTPEG